MSTHIGILTLSLSLDTVSSLKSKRSQLKPILARLHREFNVSVSEVGEHDILNHSVIACCMVSTDVKYLAKTLEGIRSWIEDHFRDIELLEYQIELI